MKSLVLVLVACAFAATEAGTLNRERRGFLSRTGFCPVEADNFIIADTRLNFYGRPVESATPTDCSESECDEDNHCSGDRKCCKNNCDAQVCTTAVRDFHPCVHLDCPKGQVCNVQHVKCKMPDCPDVPSLNRPVCVPAKGHKKSENLTDIGNHIPDTSANYQYFDQEAAAPETMAAPVDPAAYQQNDVQQQTNEPMEAGALQPGADQTLSYADQSQAPQQFGAQAAPLADEDAPDMNGMDAAQFADPNTLTPPPMDAANFYAAQEDNSPPQVEVAQYAQQPGATQADPNAGLMPLAN